MCVRPHSLVKNHKVIGRGAIRVVDEPLEHGVTEGHQEREHANPDYVGVPPYPAARCHLSDPAEQPPPHDVIALPGVLRQWSGGLEVRPGFARRSSDHVVEPLVRKTCTARTT